MLISHKYGARSVPDAVPHAADPGIKGLNVGPASRVAQCLKGGAQPIKKVKIVQSCKDNTLTQLELDQ